MTRLLRSFLAGLLAVCWVTSLPAQTSSGSIRGRVTDGATQQGLAAVRVTIGKRGTVTQSDGRYVLTDVPVGADTLRAKLIGYAPVARLVTVAAGEPLEVDVAMTAQSVNLSTVVVIGYGQKRAGDVTGSVAQVGAADFNTGTIINAQQLIENKIAGVQVVDNNEPGGGLSIRVRGQASVNAGSDPLYVLDGVPLGTGSGGGLTIGRDPLNFLNPNDIATITVLKDAAATAIYGANASNGVVLITTKQGSGQTRVEYTGGFSASSVTRLPSMLNADQFRTAVNAFAPANAGLLGTANTNWFDLVDRTAMGEQQDVTLSGANPTNSYHVSIGYLNQDGILRGTKAERIALGVNYNQRLYNDRLDLHAIVRGSRTNDQFTPDGVLYNAAQMGPTQPVYDGTSATGYYNWPGNLLTSADNPLEVLNLSSDRGVTYRSVGTLEAKYDFSSLASLQGLTGTVRLGYDVTQADRVTFYPNNIHYTTKNGTYGRYYRTTPSQLNSVLDAYVDYAPALPVGPGNIDVTAGYSYTQSHAEGEGTTVTQFASNALGPNGIPSTGLVQPNPPDIQEAKQISFFGRAGYNIDDRYLASVSLRRDASSRFGGSNQWGYFPGASIGWRLSREPFFSRISALSDLRLRVSWGKTGNQAIGNYLQHVTYYPCNAQAQVQFGGSFVCPSRPSSVDPTIKWESTATWDVGLDYSIQNGRFTGVIDWYTKHTDDLLFYVPTPAGTNFSNFVTKNIGAMRNRGYELSLNARLVDGGPEGLSWVANVNAAQNTNQLLSINPNDTTTQKLQVGGVSGGVGTTIQVLQPGYPINSFFVCRQLYQNGKPVEGKYVSLADTIASACGASGLRPYHDPAPHWIFGFGSSMSYRRFDLSFTLRAWLGNYVYNNVASNLGTYQELTRGAPYNLNSSVVQTGFMAPQYLSDYYVEKASFLRMDDLRLGYTFPWQRQQLRLFVNVQNVFTITGYSGVDPTATTTVQFGNGLVRTPGIDNNIYPRSRIVTSGLNVQF